MKLSIQGGGGVNTELFLSSKMIKRLWRAKYLKAAFRYIFICINMAFRLERISEQGVPE